MRFEDIPQFTQCAGYVVHIPWRYLEKSLADYFEMGLNMDPDFQRAHVWDDTKRIRYVEFALRGGASGMNIYTNNPNWNANMADTTDFVLVDGKQRLEAARQFLRNELPIFGSHYFKDFEDKLNLTTPRFAWHVNDLATRAEVLQWYLDLNTGGVVHSEEELARVRTLLQAEKTNPNPKDIARARKRVEEVAERKARRAAKR